MYTNKEPLALKIPCSLKHQPHDQQQQYFKYLQVRSLANTHTQKPGFITKKETQPVAQAMGISRSQFYKRMQVLVDYGYAEKNHYGYQIKAFEKVNKSLHLNLYLNNKGQYVEYKSRKAEYIKRQSTTDVRVMELLQHAHTHTELKERIRSKQNARKDRYKYYNQPETFNYNVTLETLKTKGNYPNTMYAARLNNDLEKIGLLNVQHGKFNQASLQKDCNTYSLNFHTKAKWSRLFPVLVKTKANPPKQKKQSVQLSQIEMRFRDFISTHEVKEVLIGQEYLKPHFRNRQVSRLMFPKLIAAIMNDEFLKGVFNNRFTNDNLVVTNTVRTIVDLNDMSDRFPQYSFDKVILVDRGGNYNGSRIRLEQDERKALIDYRKHAKVIDTTNPCI